MYGMEWARPLLPELRGDDRRSAPLTARPRRHSGCPPGTPVVLAPYDIASTAIGVGAVGTGQACSILGTTLCTEIVARASRSSDGEPVRHHVALGPGGYLRAFPTFAGGRGDPVGLPLLGLDGPAELGELAATGPPGAGGLSFLPYFSPAGERAPFLDPLARGAFLGLSFEHEREHVARAVLEGLTPGHPGLPGRLRGRPHELRVCGGGSASPLWLRMIADVTGMPVLRSGDTEVGARGAFLVGLVATGAASEHRGRGGAATSGSGRRTTRSPARTAAAYQDFLSLRETSARSWPLLAEMRGRASSVWIGVDLGTQSVRAMAVTDGGELLGAASRPLTSHRDGPRHEQDPEQWWRRARRRHPRGAARRAAGADPRGRRGRDLRHDPAHRPATGRR